MKIQVLSAKNLRCILLAIWGLNLFDALSTVLALHYLNAVELNPLMAQLLQAGPAVFILVKIAVVTAFLLLLWWRKKDRAATLAGWVCFTAYSLLAWWHIAMYVMWGINKLLH